MCRSVGWLFAYTRLYNFVRVDANVLHVGYWASLMQAQQTTIHPYDSHPLPPPLVDAKCKDSDDSQNHSNKCDTGDDDTSGSPVDHVKNEKSDHNKCQQARASATSPSTASSSTPLSLSPTSSSQSSGPVPAPASVNIHHDGSACRSFTSVMKGGAESIKRHPECNLFLCWPPDLSALSVYSLCCVACVYIRHARGIMKMIIHVGPVRVFNTSFFVILF